MTKKVGRNDPCPCGSGKKYKKCCAERLGANKAFQASVLSSGISNGSDLQGRAKQISVDFFNRPHSTPEKKALGKVTEGKPTPSPEKDPEQIAEKASPSLPEQEVEDLTEENPVTFPKESSEKSKQKKAAPLQKKGTKKATQRKSATHAKNGIKKVKEEESVENKPM